jgi:hypothetical protein
VLCPDHGGELAVCGAQRRQLEFEVASLGQICSQLVEVDFDVCGISGHVIAFRGG